MHPEEKIRESMMQSRYNDTKHRWWEKQTFQFAYILKWRQLEILRIKKIPLNKLHFHLWQCFPECSNFGFPNIVIRICEIFILLNNKYSAILKTRKQFIYFIFYALWHLFLSLASGRHWFILKWVTVFGFILSTVQSHLGWNILHFIYSYATDFLQDM